MTAVDGRDGDAVQADLRAVIARAKDPRALLAIGADAGPDAVRRAFHALAKRYHPTRFARSSAETLRLANEAFLAIKRAHDELQAVPGPGDASASGPILARGTTGTTAGIPTRPRSVAAVTGPVRPAHPTAAPVTTAAGTSPPRAPAAPTAPPPAGTSPPRAPAAPTAPPPAVAAPTTVRGVRFADVPAPPKTPAAPATARGARLADVPAAPRSSTVPVAVVPPATTPARPTGAAPVIPRATGATPVVPRPTGAAPVIPRTTAPIATGPARPPSGPAPAITSASAATGADDEEARSAAALDLLRRRLWKDAEAAYAALAAGHPAERRYRAYRDYARGRILQDEGQLDAARAEWERALRTDPTLTLAQAAIDQLPEPPKPTGGGLLSRLFKR